MAALVRELSEELGVTATGYSLVETFDRQLPDRRNAHHVFAVSSWEGEPANISDENADLRWFTLAELATLSNLTPDMLRVATSADGSSPDSD